MLRYTSLAAVGACAILALGCERRDASPDVSAATVREDARQAVDSAADYAATQRRAFERRAERVATDVDREIADARVKLSELDGEAEERLDAAIGRAEAARATLREEMDDLAQATGEAYRTASERMTDALAEMDEARREVAAAMAGRGTTS